MHRFGRRHQPDERDAEYRLAPVRTLRRERWWNGGRVLDQGDSAACVGHAWAGWLLAPPVAGQFVDPFGLYELAGRYEAGDTFDPLAGTTIRAGAKILHKLGFIAAYHWATDLQALAYTLLELGPVVMGSNWYAGMDRPRRRDRQLELDGELVGGHAYLLDGLDLDECVVRVKNNWGGEWGTGGRAWLALDDCARLLAEEGEACLAIERRPAPGARAAAA
jgi:hypothetical protein